METNMNETTTNRNGPMDINDAARFLRLKKNFIYQLVFRRKLPAYKPGGKKLYFRQCDLEDYAFRNRRETADNILAANTAKA